MNRGVIHSTNSGQSTAQAQRQRDVQDIRQWLIWWDRMINRLLHDPVKKGDSRTLPQYYRHQQTKARKLAKTHKRYARHAQNRIRRLDRQREKLDTELVPHKIVAADKHDHHKLAAKRDRADDKMSQVIGEIEQMAGQSRLARRRPLPWLHKIKTRDRRLVKHLQHQ